MRVLLSGGESECRVKLLLKLTRIVSPDIIAALHDHLVRGINDTAAATFNGVSDSNFNRALNTLNDVATIVEDIKNHDWQHLRNK